MTVPSETSSVTYSGNDTTYVFPFTFDVVSASHLVVSITDTNGSVTTLVEGSNYTVTLPVTPGPGSITRIRFEGPTQFNYPVPTGSTIRIERLVPVTQSYSFKNNRQLRVEALESAFDYQVYVSQQIQRYAEEVDARAIAASDALEVRVTTLEDLVPVGAPVSAAMQPVIAATTLASARSEMGITDISAAMQPVVTAETTAAARTQMGTTDEAIAMALLFG